MLIVSPDQKDLTGGARSTGRNRAIVVTCLREKCEECVGREVGERHPTDVTLIYPRQAAGDDSFCCKVL